MAWPLVAMAAAGALSKFGKSRAQSAQRKNEEALAADRAKRASMAWKLSELPQLHGAEQKKTMGNLFARGMWGNFGRNPATGAARSPELAAILADPWKYRDAAALSKLNPHDIPLPKLKGPGVWGTLGSVLGGAAEGAATYYGSGMGGSK